MRWREKRVWDETGTGRRELVIELESGDDKQERRVWDRTRSSRSSSRSSARSSRSGGLDRIAANKWKNRVWERTCSGFFTKVQVVVCCVITCRRIYRCVSTLKNVIVCGSLELKRRGTISILGRGEEENFEKNLVWISQTRIQLDSCVL